LQKKPESDAEIEFESIEENSRSLGAEDGVYVLSEKTGNDENFQNEFIGTYNRRIETKQHRQPLHIRFQPIIRSRFRILPPDDGFPKFRV
jgi:hypothetical protein